MIALRRYAAAHVRRTADGRILPWIDEVQNPDTGDWISRTMLARDPRNRIPERGKDELRGDSPSFEAVTAIVSRAFRDGALSCAISGHASPPAVSFRRHLPVKLSHWHRPTDSAGRLLFCLPHPGERDPMPPVCAAAPR